MNRELFLDYLVARQYLTSTQKQSCLNQLKNSQTPLAQFLIDERYLASETLRTAIQNFQKTQLSFSPNEEETNTKPQKLFEDIIDVLEKSTKPQKLPPALVNTVNLSRLDEDEEKNTLPYSPESITKEVFPEVQNATLVSTRDLDERYSVIETLGQGGMGVVQRVQDRLLKREVALKKIRRADENLQISSRKQKIMILRLHREAEITAILEHPNIVPLHDMQRNKQGELYFTMRKIEGKTLTALLRQKRESEANETDDESKLLSIFFKICDAVSYAHSKNILHRDLKPDNIMVGQFGEVYVMDWGIAKQLAEVDPLQPSPEHSSKTEYEELLKTIGGLGTPGYMAPEQAENASSVKIQSDIFSLGIILRQCYILMDPWEELRAKKMEMSQKKSFDDNLRKRIPPDIQAIIEKATHIKWSQRYNSVQEMVKDIERYLKHIRVSAREYSLLETLGKWGRRNWKKIGVALFLLSLGGFLWFYSSWVKKQELQKQFQEKQHQFNSLVALAQKEQQQAQPLELGVFQSIDEQTRYLLKALNYWNLALNLQPQEQHAEREKFQLIQKIIELAFVSEDYTLAAYLATETEPLQSISKDLKNTIREKVHQEQTAKLKAHLLRLNYWKDRFKTSQQEGELAYNIAIFEISKMSEKEIFEELLQILQEGTQYFLGEDRTLVLNLYYNTFVTALGRLENKQAVEFLLQSLTQLCEKYSQINPEPTDPIEYMTAISYALLHLQPKNISERFQSLRQKMGTNDLFWKRTREMYRELLILEKGNATEGNPEPKPSLSLENKQAQYEVYKKAEAAKDRKDYPEAIKLYSELINLNPPPLVRAELFKKRGKAKSSLKDNVGALQDYNESIKIDPKSAYIYKDRGQLWKDLKEWDKALADYNEAIQQKPDLYRAYGERGQIYFRKNQIEEAFKDIEYAIKMEPQRYSNYLYRGEIYLFQKKYSNALEDYQKAIQLDPQEYEGYEGRGTIKKVFGNYSEALDDYTKAIQLSPSSSDLYVKRGSVKIFLEDYSGSVLDFKEAIRLNPFPTYPDPFYNLGYAYELLKNEEEAILQYEDGLSRQLKLVPLRQYLNLMFKQVETLSQQGNYAEAKQKLQRCLQFATAEYPEHEQVQKKLQQMEREIQGE